jgi:spermidine/putrescine transport system substrate-binding protein
MTKQPESPRLKVIDRRSFLKLTGIGVAAAGLGPALAACQPAATATVAPTKAVGGRLDFLSWEGYDLPDCMKAWQDAHGVTMSSTYIGDHSEIQAKLTTAQTTGYDLITYYQGYADLYRNEVKILQELDRSRIPNFEKLYEMFRTKDFWVDSSGKVWGTPFTWGAEGCNYNADKTSAPESWKDLLKPEFKDKLGMIDDMNGALIIAGRILGYGDQLPNLTPAQLQETKDLLLQFKSNARGIAASYGDLTDLLVSGEVIVTFPGWAAVNVWAQERGANVQHTMPAEGGFTFIDAFAIPAQADNYDTSIEWINEALSPQVQACAAAALSAGVVTPDAVQYLDEKTAQLYPYDKIEDVFTKAPVYSLPPRESDTYATYDDWLSMWEEVKAA